MQMKVYAFIPILFQEKLVQKRGKNNSEYGKDIPFKIIFYLFIGNFMPVENVLR